MTGSTDEAWARLRRETLDAVYAGLTRAELLEIRGCITRALGEPDPAELSAALRGMARRVGELREVRNYLGEVVNDQHRANEIARHARHRPWLRGPVAFRLAQWAYSLGIIAGLGHSWGGAGGCRGCMTIAWRGRRPYILGLSRDAWLCIRSGHRRRALQDGSGICAACFPCPACGSPDPGHDVFGCDSTPSFSPVPRAVWARCLLRAHRTRPAGDGRFCVVCTPCPYCGSGDPDHSLPACFHAHRAEAANHVAH